MKRDTGICFAWAVTEHATEQVAHGPGTTLGATLGISGTTPPGVGIWAFSPLVSASLLLQYVGVILAFMYYLIWFGLETLQNFSILMVTASSFYALSAYKDFTGTSSFRERETCVSLPECTKLRRWEKGLSDFILST